MTAVDQDVPGAARQVLAVAGVAVREAARRRNAWLVAAGVGVVFAALLLALSLVAGRVEQVTGQRAVTVAIAGDIEGAGDLLEALGEGRLRFDPRDDPFAEVTDRQVLVGLELPDGVDVALATGEPVELRIAYRRSEPRSVEAFVLLGLAVQDEELALIAPDVTPQLGTTVISIVSDAGLARIEQSRRMAAMAALLCLSVISTAGAFFGASREQRSVEVLLTLPLRRSGLSAGVALGVLPVAVTQVFAGLALVVAVALIPGTTLSQSGSVALAMAIGAVVPTVLLVGMACCAGCLAGALGRGSDDAVSLGDLLGVPFVTVGVALLLAGELPATLLTASVPVLGQALLVREAVAGTLTLGVAVLSCLSAVALSALLLALAAWRLGAENSVLRTTS